MKYKTYSNTPRNETLEYADCPLCGSDTPNDLWNNGSYSFSKCGACGLVYQHPRPRQEELLYRYDDDYFDYELENEKAFFGLMKLALADVRFSEEIEPNAAGLRFLDVGCATGMLLEEMKQRGWRGEGVEVCAPSAEYGISMRGVKINIGTLEETGFPPEEFDVVHASHLIEHLTDPVGFVSEVYRILKPGGWALITTPNVGGLQARLFGSQWRSAIADHICLFSRRTLRKTLQEGGFVVERWKSWGGMAAGIAPVYVKKMLDTAAKGLGFGDVMIMRVRKPLTDR